MQEQNERESGVWCARRACKNQLSARVACGVPAVHAKTNCIHEPTERESGVWCAPCACKKATACKNQLSARVACVLPAVHTS